MEGTRQDAAGVVRRQPGAQLADPVRNQRHENLVSLALPPTLSLLDWTKNITIVNKKVADSKLGTGKDFSLRNLR